MVFIKYYITAAKLYVISFNCLKSQWRANAVLPTSLQKYYDVTLNATLIT